MLTVFWQFKQENTVIPRQSLASLMVIASQLDQLAQPHIDKPVIIAKIPVRYQRTF